MASRTYVILLRLQSASGLHNSLDVAANSIHDHKKGINLGLSAIICIVLMKFNKQVWKQAKQGANIIFCISAENFTSQGAGSKMLAL